MEGLYNKASLANTKMSADAVCTGQHNAVKTWHISMTPLREIIARSVPI